MSDTRQDASSDFDIMDKILILLGIGCLISTATGFDLGTAAVGVLCIGIPIARVI